MADDRERVLITGGASGIGLAIAEWCREEGYETVTIDKKGGDIEADLSSPDATKEALNAVLASGPVHRLVNNVGVVVPANISDTTLDELSLAYELNVRCAVQCVQAVLPSMRVRGFGRVVNIASRAILGKEDRTAYAGTKAAVVGMTRTWALELGGQGITVNAIAPGPIATELFYNANSAEQQERIRNSVPVARMGSPRDIASAASYLLGEDAGFISGQVLFVCGGTSIQQNAF